MRTTSKKSSRHHYGFVFRSSALVALAALASTGCGQGLDTGAADGGEHIDSVQSALVTLNDFNRNTPSALDFGTFSGRDFLTERVGYGSQVIGFGTQADQIISYIRPSGNPGPWMIERSPSSNLVTPGRPAAAWINNPDNFSTLYPPNITTGKVQDTLAPPGPDVFTQLSGCPGFGTMCMLGSPGVTLAASGSAALDAAAFGLGYAGQDAQNQATYQLRQAYRPGGFWTDITTLGIPLTVAGTTYAPTSSPFVANRTYGTFNSDSAWVSCGTASPARACEVRLSPNQGVYMTTFGGNTSVMAPNTQPVSFGNTVAGTQKDDRWVFAVVVENGVKTLSAKRETSAVNSTAQPTFSVQNIDSDATASFSSPTPYANTAGQTSVVYLRFPSSGNTQVWRAVWSGSAWTKTNVHDVGMALPASTGISSVAHPLSSAPSGNAANVFFRLPTSTAGEARDTVELDEQPDGKFSKTVLPAAFDNSGLFVAQPSTSSIYQVNKSTGLPTALGSAQWAGVTAFTTDGIGLGYAVAGGTLFEVNLNDGLKRQIGATNALANTTLLAYGFDPDKITPRLWTIKTSDNKLYRINLADATMTAVTSAFWSGAVTMTSVTFDGRSTALYIINGNHTLYAVGVASPGTVVPIQLGAIGDWVTPRAITYNLSVNRLFITDGADDAHTRVYRVDPVNGDWHHGYSGYFSNATFLTTVNGVSYLMKSRQILRINSTSDTYAQNITLSSVGGQYYDYSETGMSGISW